MLDNCCILDFETTGVLLEEDFVIEIGALRILNGRIAGQLQGFVNFGGVFPADCDAAKVNGITQADIDGGFPPKVAFPVLRAFLGNATIVAHNAAFDVSFLNRSLHRYGATQPLTNPFLCTQLLAHVLPGVPADVSLAALCQHFGIKRSFAHQALSDCFDTFHLLYKLLELVAQAGGDIDATLAGLTNQVMPPRPGRLGPGRWLPEYASICRAVEGQAA